MVLQTWQRVYEPQQLSAQQVVQFTSGFVLYMVQHNVMYQCYMKGEWVRLAELEGVPLSHACESYEVQRQKGTTNR